MDVDTLKRTAKAAARANGTSYQTELNIIARSHGHTHWGALASAIRAGEQEKCLPPGSYIDDEFSEPTAFLPIALAPHDGTRLLVAGGPIYAAACWRSGMWTYPSGTDEAPGPIEQLDFEPTHFARRR